MDRYALFVDAGYFFAAGAQAASGSQTPPPRKLTTIKSPRAMLKALCDKASYIASNMPFDVADEIPPDIAGSMPLLRIYWYDAIPGSRLSLEQSTLALLSGVKLRLGALNGIGEQKGVDSLIVTDIIDLARNRAIADAVVVSGDDDLRIAVQVAQSFGVRVHILAAGDFSINVSTSLRMEADSVTALEASWFEKHLELAQPEPKEAAPAITTPIALPHPGVSLDEISKTAELVIEELLNPIAEEQLDQLIRHFETQTSIPPEYDRRLVAKVSNLLAGRMLVGNEPRHIRGLFVRAVKARGASRA